VVHATSKPPFDGKIRDLPDSSLKMKNSPGGVEEDDRPKEQFSEGGGTLRRSAIALLFAEKVRWDVWIPAAKAFDVTNDSARGATIKLFSTTGSSSGIELLSQRKGSAAVVSCSLMR